MVRLALKIGILNVLPWLSLPKPFFLWIKSFFQAGIAVDEQPQQDNWCAEQRLHLVPEHNSIKELMPELQRAYYESVKCHNFFAGCETLYFLFLLKHHYASVGIADLKVMEWDQHRSSFQRVSLFASEKLIGFMRNCFKYSAPLAVT